MTLLLPQNVKKYFQEVTVLTFGQNALHYGQRIFFFNENADWLRKFGGKTGDFGRNVC